MAKLNQILMGLALLLCAAPLAAQSCYIQLDDATGVPLPPSQLAELEAAACELRDAFPVEFQGDFAVYDFGFYLHQEGFAGGVPEVFQAKVAEVESESAYFLLFGRQLSRGGVTSEVWVEVRLPEGGAYPCLRDAYQSGLIANHVESKVAEALGQGLQPSAHAIALAGLSSLTHLVDKSVNCCNSQQNARAVTSCTDCWFGGSSAEAEYAGLLDGYGYLEYTGVSVTVDTLETPYTGALKSDYGITLSGPGIHLSLTEETNNFLNGLLPLGIFSRRVDVYSYGASDCELLDQLLQTSAVKLDQTGLAYEEKIIILNFGGQPRVFYKFAVGPGYGPGGAAFKGGPPDSRQAVFFPAIAGWIMKKAAMAGTGVLMHVGITVAFEKWFGDYETWGEAWDNSSFTAWELFYAAASGALAEHVVLQFFGDIINGMVGYVLSTPSSSFSWEGFFAGGVATGITDGVLGLLTGGLLGDLSDKGKAIFQKYAPNINLTPGGPGGGDPWYRVLKELVQMSPTFVTKPGTFGAWKFVFDGTSIRTRVDVLESISTALQRGIKDVPDIVSYAGHPNIVAYTVEHIFRGHGNNGGRHHISALIADNSRKLVDRLKETSDGFYEAVIRKSDGSTSTKSFWPDTWDENQIMDELKHVMSNNPVNIPGTNNWEGFTTGGQKVRYYVKASDNSIISAFPVLD